MSAISTRNRTRQIGGTATTTVVPVDVTAAGNGVSPVAPAPTSLALQNIGAATLYYSTSAGVTYNALTSGSSFSWPYNPVRHDCGIYEVLVKTLSGTAVYQFDAGY